MYMYVCIYIYIYIYIYILDTTTCVDPVDSMLGPSYGRSSLGDDDEHVPCRAKVSTSPRA